MGMIAELTCVCQAYLNLDNSEEEGASSDPVWYMVYRFANAHVRCQFVTPPPEEEKKAPAAEQDAPAPDA